MYEFLEIVIGRAVREQKVELETNGEGELSLPFTRRSSQRPRFEMTIADLSFVFSPHTISLRPETEQISTYTSPRTTFSSSSSFLLSNISRRDPDRRRRTSRFQFVFLWNLVHFELSHLNCLPFRSSIWTIVSKTSERSRTSTGSSFASIRDSRPGKRLSDSLAGRSLRRRVLLGRTGSNKRRSEVNGCFGSSRVWEASWRYWQRGFERRWVSSTLRRLV